MMWWDDGGWGAGTWLLMSVMMVAVWGGLIILVVWLLQGLRTDNTSSNNAPKVSADDVLAERYARGEIDEDEFNRRRDVLHPRSNPR